MSTYQHLPGIITYEQNYSQSFNVKIDNGAASETITLSLSDAHAYGETSAPAPSAGTLLAGIKSAIDATFAATSPAITSSTASWILDETPYPKWRIDFQLDAPAADFIITELADPITPLGIRVVTLTRKHAATDQGGNVWRLESNGYTGGVWAPGMRPAIIPDETSTARVARSPFYPNESTKVQLSTRTDYDVSYELVDAAMRSSFERTQFPTMEVRAGLYLALRDKCTGGLLDQLVTAAAESKGMRLHIEQGEYLDVDLDSDDLKTSNFSSESTGGGIHYTVDLPLVGV